MDIELETLYVEHCAKVSDVYQHLPTLRELASDCSHITEISDNIKMSSTLTFLTERPKSITAYRTKNQAIQQIKETLHPLREQTVLLCYEKDSREIKIAETDLLYIDTFHSYKRLIDDLEAHHVKVRKFIIISGTATFGSRGEDGSHPGMKQAIHEFIDKEFQWKIVHDVTNNNGLVVLERDSSHDSSSSRIYSIAHFDLPDIRWVERFPVGMTDHTKELTQKEIEWQADRLNRALRYGKITGVERNFTIIEVGNKSVTTSYLVYHIGFKSRPPGK